MSTLERLKAQFNVMEDIVGKVASGNLRGLIITGPAGIGKTFNVLKTLKDYQLYVAPLAGIQAEIEVCAGHMTTVGLVQALWRNRQEANTLVLDDIDTVLDTLDAINILKAALDTGSQRHVSYMTQNAALRKAGIPQHFNFNGAIILITNQDMENCKGKMAPHFKALVSRCFYFDLGFEGREDCMTWIQHVSETTGMLGDAKKTSDILRYMRRNLKDIRELSLRTAVKLSSIYGKGWKEVADFTVLT
ncbi:MAG: ATP-binding protein [Gammaproteobacteria bacterium]|nr:ATP-binding protein [Gammaproteobacteria bacterium]